MNLLLSNFNSNNEDLSELLISYQEYFTFSKKDNNTCLYLDINNLRQYLIEGKEIKYRNFIFLFLENIINKKRNYNFKYDKYYHKLNNIINEKILDYEDMKNIKKITSIINYLNTSTIKIRNNNIYNLDDNLYADIKNGCFINKKFLYNYKFTSKIEGFIINNKSYLKNISIVINCINNSKKKNNLKPFLINTKCNLVITTKLKMELFIDELKSNNENIKYIEIHHINNFKYYNYIDINNYEYMFININILTNYFKNFNMKYNDNLKSSLNNLIIEQMINDNLINSVLSNIFIYNWNNLIIDNYNNIGINELDYLKNISVINYKYINIEDNIDKDDNKYDNILKNMSLFLINEDDLNKYGYNNFQNIIKNELIIKNSNNDIYNINEDEVINIENNEESEIISKLNDTKNNEIELAELFINSSNKFIYKDTSNNIKDLIKKDNNSLINVGTNNDSFLNTNIGMSKNSFCCICMDRIDDTKFCILGCGHYFCKNCILMHKINEELNNFQNKCPMCRYNYNLIYNIANKLENNNIIISNLEGILNKEINKKILIVAEHNKILGYINDSLKGKYKIDNYKKKNINMNKDINLIPINYLKKNIINNIDIFIFFTFSDKGYNKYIEIKNIYNDYYLNKNKIKFYLFNYNKN